MYNVHSYIMDNNGQWTFSVLNMLPFFIFKLNHEFSGIQFIYKAEKGWTKRKGLI